MRIGLIFFKGPNFAHSGTDVMILAFLTQNKAKFGKKFIITLVLDKNAKFLAENCQKLPKIVIITSVPGHPEEPGPLVRTP
jgi:hypothetical protein